jgi:CIC family chloride channel protein
MTPTQRFIASITPSTHLRSAGRAVALSAVVGVASGIGAVLFSLLTHVVMHYALDVLVGYHPGGPTGEAHLFEPSTTPFRPWLLLIVPTLGGLLSGLITWLIAPEAQGGGTSAAIEAYHHKRGIIRTRVPIVKILASAVTLGTGGSGGQEGPISQIGAGIGSFLGTRLKVTDQERRVLMAAGLGGGIGAIFHAPLAGAMFAVEVLYRDADFESEVMIPSFIATTLAYSVYNVILAIGGYYLGELHDFDSLFSVAPGLQFRDVRLFIPLTVLTLVTVAASLLYVRSIETSKALFKKLHWPTPLTAMLGGLLVGAVALLINRGLHMVYQLDTDFRGLSVLAIGYGTLQRMLVDYQGATLLIGVMLAIGLGKIVTTAITMGSGGSAGLFGPSMVIGGCLGGVVGMIGHQVAPEIVTRIDIFVILGMAGLFSASAKVPLSTLLLVTEITASYELLMPAMWVCALSFLLSRAWTLFPAQVHNRLESPVHRGDFVIDVLQGITVGDILASGARQFVTVAVGTPFPEVVKHITGTKQTSFPVVDADNRYVGLFSLNDVRQFLYDPDAAKLVVAHDLATNVEPLTAESTLGAALELFALGHHDELPVIDADDDKRPIIALLRRQDVMTAYSQRLMQMRAGN